HKIDNPEVADVGLVVGPDIAETDSINVSGPVVGSRDTTSEPFYIESGPRWNLGYLEDVGIVEGAELEELPVVVDTFEDLNINEEPDRHVEKWYRKDYFLRAYKYVIQQIPSMNMWPATSNIKNEPPVPKMMPGRPKRCRRKSKDEPKKKWGKWSKKGVKITCSKCQQQGHNKTHCLGVVSTLML
ncbi:hypothetical protein A4A49_51227, partial [Nicotiana attenuata]